MNQVTLYGFYEETLLEDVSTIIANLYGDNDTTALSESIKNHPKFKQNFQLFAEFLFAKLQKSLAQHCEKVKLHPVEFYEIKITDGSVKADCNYNQESFDALMVLAYLPLNIEYRYESDHLGVNAHTYFWWEEQENEITYQKILELFDFSEQEV